MTLGVERRCHEHYPEHKGHRKMSVSKHNHARELLSRDQIQEQYGLSRRWLELAALNGGGPPMVKISTRMVRYQRGAFEEWLTSRTVASTSQPYGTD